MKLTTIFCLAALLSGCTAPHFVADRPSVAVTTQTPDHFEFPARFALARAVYGTLSTAGAQEAALWSEVANGAEDLGTFSPLVATIPGWALRDPAKLLETARQQRFDYLILVQMHPSTGAADVVLYHVASSGVMATTQAVVPSGGRHGFWGGRINNHKKLERTTLRIAKAVIPSVEALLRGAASRQR